MLSADFQDGGIDAAGGCERGFAARQRCQFVEHQPVGTGCAGTDDHQRGNRLGDAGVHRLRPVADVHALRIADGADPVFDHCRAERHHAIKSLRAVAGLCAGDGVDVYRSRRDRRIVRREPAGRVPGSGRAVGIRGSLRIAGILDVRFL